MWHEMVIASIAILLILMHVRSVFVICVTLPLAVLFSFLLMWVLRQLGIIDIQANIMSLAGITISIGILVDQAIVMTENATHHLKEHFGDRRSPATSASWSFAACRTVGRPIFFSVMIMLISFIPVFMLSGREGKLFHPLAFTKSFAMIGVAIISVTLVPALIPHVHQGPAAERRRELDRPQLHQHLQAAADLGAAAAEPGDVDVRRALGSRGRHVPAPGSLGHFGLGGHQRRQWASLRPPVCRPRRLIDILDYSCFVGIQLAQDVFQLVAEINLVADSRQYVVVNNVQSCWPRSA